MYIQYPKDFFLNQIDEHFQEESVVLAEHFDVGYTNKRCIYRGWMTNNYQTLNSVIHPFLYNYFNDMREWYGYIQNYTIPTTFSKEPLNELPYDKVFIRGFNKSIGQDEPITTVQGVDELLTTDLYSSTENGIAYRQWYTLEDERRYFIVDNQVFSDNEIPGCVESVTKLISGQFYTIDVAFCVEKGYDVIVELGDGQVSSLKENSYDVLVAALKKFEELYW